MPTSPRTKELASVITFFWNRVDKLGPVHPVCGQCWTWLGGKNTDGYGNLSKSKYVGATLAHRVSWIIHNGDIPKDLFVLHKCDNPSCVRPDHLFLGTNSDNIADSKAKGRWSEGERCPLARLTQKQVDDIRTRYRRGLGRVLAEEFGVSRMTISLIIRKKRYPS